VTLKTISIQKHSKNSSRVLCSSYPARSSKLENLKGYHCCSSRTAKWLLCMENELRSCGEK